MRLIKFMPITGLFVLLTACGTNHNNDYLQAQQGAALKVPSNLSTSAIKAEYPVPAGATWHSNKPMPIYPPGSSLEKNMQAKAKEAQAKEQKATDSIRLGEDSMGSTALNIDRPYTTVWQAFPNAAKRVDYAILHSDSRIGLYLVKIDKDLYQFTVMKTANNASIVTVREQHGVTLSDTQSQQIMQKLAIGFKKVLS